MFVVHCGAPISNLVEQAVPLAARRVQSRQRVSNVRVGDEDARSRDVLGRVYEYFLSRFASAEGKKGGEFYTPRCVVKLLVEMLEPWRGRVYDPCCGSSGMFVQSIEFIRAHAWRFPPRGTDGVPGPRGDGDERGTAPFLASGNGGRRARADISIYGQESNYTTWRLAKMNLAIRGIEGRIAHGDSFHDDRHPDLKADFILANPPFNVSDWGGERLAEDRRWRHGPPPKGNANFAWVQHIVHHLAPAGVAGFVLANGSMSSSQSGEGAIRKNLIEADLVDCMVALPGQLFYSTQIPACLWFLVRDRKQGGWFRDRRGGGLGSGGSGGAVGGGDGDRSGGGGGSSDGSGSGGDGSGGGDGGGRFRNRRGEILFIDARKLGRMVDRTHRELTDEDVARIAGVYHAWRQEASIEEAGGGYADVPGFCKSAPLDEVRRHGHVLTPGRYVGAEPREGDGEPFEAKMTRLVAELRAQQAEGARLDAAIAANLKRLGFAIRRAKRRLERFLRSNYCAHRFDAQGASDMGKVTATTDVKLIAIGNSRGIRLPKVLLRKYGWSDSLVLQEMDEGVFLYGKQKNKLSWMDTYRAMATDGEDWSDLDETVADGLD